MQVDDTLPPEVVVLIDGDVLCYRACEDRYTRRTANVEDPNAAQGYGKLVVYTGDVEFSDEENEEYLNKAYNSIKSMITEMCEMNFTTTYKMAVAGEGNFRKDIFPEYKANRHADPSKRNPFVPILRKMAAGHGIATEAHGMEADDLIRIWAAECEAAGIPYVICSIDKDLKMIPGMHWLIHKQEFFESTPDFALRFYHEQLLMGDMTDNIQGVPGLGPIKAKALLENCTTEQEFQETVMQVYYTIVHQWRNALLLTGQLIYLKKHADDWFTLDNWPKELPVDVGEDKPKKTKSKKKMTEWTIETALKAVDPRSITTKQQWESAIMFLLELDGIDETVHDAVEILSERDQVPKGEIEAYQRMCAKIKTLPAAMTSANASAHAEVAIAAVTPPPPLSFMKVVEPPATPVFEAMKLPTLPAFPFAPKVELPKLPPALALPTVPQVTPLPQLPTTGLPVFNPALLKKK